MKTRVLLIIGILLFNYSLVNSKETGAGKKDVRKSSINLFTSPDLYPLTTRWVSEYSKINPGQNIQLITTTKKDLKGGLETGPAIGFISDESFPGLNSRFSWSMVVGRNVIVPVMNPANPLRDEICRKGISSKGFASLSANCEKLTWNALVGESPSQVNSSVHYYFINDPSVLSVVSNFTNTKKAASTGIPENSEKELISAIQKDPNGLGFCTLANITDQQTKSLISAIQIIPIDKNENGKIDYTEAIYDNLQEFTRGIWIGKYPNALSGKIYLVSTSQPTNGAERSFLNWVLTDGQQFLISCGYSDLAYTERQSQLDKINGPSAFTAVPAEPKPILRLEFLIICLIGIFVVVLEFVVRRVRNKKRAVSGVPTTLLQVFDKGAPAIPKGLYFDKTHTWAFMKKDGLVKIGIDDFLQHVTGQLTRVDLKNPGDKIKKGDHLLTIIQKGKHLKIYSPVTGKIISQNSNLIAHTSLLNTAPFSEGWIYTLEPTNWLLEIQFMSMAERYSDWLKTEYLRLRDFFESAVRIHVPAFVMVLQDGGVLRDGILADLGPEVWEDFQTKFIDISR